MPLPIVLPEIFDAVGAEMDNHNDFSTRLTTRLQEHNPDLLAGFMKIAGSLNDKDAIWYMVLGGFLMYRLLESQSEADDLRSEIE